GGKGGSGGIGGFGGFGGFAGSSGKGGSGGIAGFGGFSGKGGAVGWSGLGECFLDAKCIEHSDCCNCTSLPQSGISPAPACTDNTCVTTACENADHKGPACVLQHCSMQIDCDTSKVTCDVAQQPCQAGKVHSVHGVCWGPCVEASQCDHVDSCDKCDPAFYVCVAQTALGVFGYHCEKIPPACAANKTCGCMKDYFCGSTEVCEDVASGQIVCACAGCT
ncbi:MAG TPA: hypothetical protein PLI95_26270, partial [Polyangiaceae bacterium]|nr:hypothetical protein [Polyangiaceae bacterium]